MAGVPYTSDYRYDGMGNRTQNSRVSAAGSSATTSTPNALNQLTSVTTNITNGPTVTSNLYYDTAGNLTTTVNSDGSGRTTYGYDDADRLTRIERRGNTGQLVTVSEFGYDYASRRAFTREYDFANGGWTNPIVTRDVFDGLDVVQERNANNQVTAQLVRDGNIGGILSRTTSAGAAFYGYDGNGNVTLLTNSTGQDVGHYRYDAFGNTLEAVGARADENPYRFSTKELHGPSGLYDYGFRFYSPGMGRWMNRDPLSEAGGINLYGMVGNNPINDVDEYGLVRWKDVKDAVVTWVNDVLTPPKATSTSDEAGADDWAAAQNVAGAKNRVEKVGAKPNSRPINSTGRRAGAINPNNPKSAAQLKAEKDARYINDKWSKQSFASPRASALHHLSRHGLPGQDLLTYTQRAVGFWHRNKDSPRRTSISLSDGSTGIKIVSAVEGMYGIYTPNGKIVSYGRDGNQR